MGLTAEDMRQQRLSARWASTPTRVAHALKMLQERGLIVGQGVDPERRYRIEELGRSALQTGIGLERVVGNDVSELIKPAPSVEEATDAPLRVAIGARAR